MYGWPVTSTATLPNGLSPYLAGYTRRVSAFTPPLSVQELPGQVRLTLGTLGHGTGPTLQDAADDLVRRMLDSALALRAGGLHLSGELGPPDLAAMAFLDELGEIAEAGGDIRRRILG